MTVLVAVPDSPEGIAALGPFRLLTDGSPASIHWRNVSGVVTPE